MGSFPDRQNFHSRWLWHFSRPPIWPVARANARQPAVPTNFLRAFLRRRRPRSSVSARPSPSLTATPIVPDFGFNASGMLQGGILPFLIDPHLRMPYSQSWHFGVQHELGGNLLVEVNYVGSKGARLLRVVDGNPPQPALLAQLDAFCVRTNPSNSGFHTQSGQCDQTTLQFDNLWIGAESGVLPFDAVNNNAFLHAEFFTGAASSTYHALQTNITKRLSRGIAVQAAYTCSHANRTEPGTLHGCAIWSRRRPWPQPFPRPWD